MKKIKNIFAPAALFAASLMALCSCSDEIPYDTGDGEGRLIIKTSISNDVKGSVSRGSRAGVTDDELAAKLDAAREAMADQIAEKEARLQVELEG